MPALIARPNGLAFSRPLECTTLIDRRSHLLHLDAKIAPIQRVGWNAMLGGGRRACRIVSTATPYGALGFKVGS
jgi:hypothetical protein